MLLRLTWQSKAYNKRKSRWERTYWRAYFLLVFIPIFFDNYKTEYIHANGKPLEDE